MWINGRMAMTGEYRNIMKKIFPNATLASINISKLTE
jgi:hypothetical protein